MILQLRLTVPAPTCLPLGWSLYGHTQRQQFYWTGTGIGGPCLIGGNAVSASSTAFSTTITSATWAGIGVPLIGAKSNTGQFFMMF